MATPTTSWDENSPAGSDSLNQGDNRIRELKTQIREVIDVDHKFNSSGTDEDNGCHDQVTLLEKADIGSGAVGKTILGSQTVSGKGELVYTDEDDNDVQITTEGKIRTLGLKATAVADMTNLMALIYPIGFVITLGVSTNPGTLLGIGTWTAIAGRVIVGIDSGQTEFDTLDETGGSKTVDLAHAHSGSAVGNANIQAGGTTGPGDGINIGDQFRQHTHALTVASDLSASQSVLNPYIVKYVWQRTA